MVFISVNTPTKTKGIGAGQASDLKWAEACPHGKWQKYAQGQHNSSRKEYILPVRTAETI